MSSTQRKQAIARHYDGQVDYWRDAYTGQDEAFASYQLTRRRDLVLRFVDEHLGVQSPRTADIGCGAGALMMALLERGHQVSGLDISEKMVDSVRRTVVERFPGRSECIVGDADALPYATGSFDCVVSVGVLSHQADPRRAAAELGRIVEDNGLVIVTVPNLLKLQHLLDPYTFIALAFRIIGRIRPSTLGRELGVRGSAKGNDFAIRKHHIGELKAIFEDSGLVIHETVPCTFGPLTLWGKTILTFRDSVRLSIFLESLAARRGFGFLRLLASDWIIRLQRSGSTAPEVLGQHEGTATWPR